VNRLLFLACIALPLLAQTACDKDDPPAPFPPFVTKEIDRGPTKYGLVENLAYTYDFKTGEPVHIRLMSWCQGLVENPWGNHDTCAIRFYLRVTQADSKFFYFFETEPVDFRAHIDASKIDSTKFKQRQKIGQKNSSTFALTQAAQQFDDIAKALAAVTGEPQPQEVVIDLPLFKEDEKMRHYIATQRCRDSKDGRVFRNSCPGARGNLAEVVPATRLADRLIALELTYQNAEVVDLVFAGQANQLWPYYLHEIDSNNYKGPLVASNVSQRYQFLPHLVFSEGHNLRKPFLDPAFGDRCGQIYRLLANKSPETRRPKLKGPSYFEIDSKMDREASRLYDSGPIKELDEKEFVPFSKRNPEGYFPGSDYLRFHPSYQIHRDIEMNQKLWPFPVTPADFLIFNEKEKHCE
jgi:hypothetical protein